MCYSCHGGISGQGTLDLRANEPVGWRSADGGHRVQSDGQLTGRKVRLVNVSGKVEKYTRSVRQVTGRKVRLLNVSWKVGKYVCWTSAERSESTSARQSSADGSESNPTEHISWKVKKYTQVTGRRVKKYDARHGPGLNSTGRREGRVF